MTARSALRLSRPNASELIKQVSAPNQQLHDLVKLHCSADVSKCLPTHGLDTAQNYQEIFCPEFEKRVLLAQAVRFLPVAGADILKICYLLGVSVLPQLYGPLKLLKVQMTGNFEFVLESLELGLTNTGSKLYFTCREAYVGQASDCHIRNCFPNCLRAVYKPLSGSAVDDSFRRDLQQSDLAAASRFLSP